MEEEEKWKQLKYLKQLQDKILAKNAALLKGIKGSQVIGSKHKEVTSEDKKGWWPFKKTKERQPEKYCEVL